jgi:uncharacterized membrane protein
MRLILLDALIGLLLLAVIAAAAYKRRRRIRSARVCTCGWILLALPLPAAVVAHLTLQLSTRIDQAFFIAGAASFAIGAVIVLGNEDEDWHQESEDDLPPWWPAFERDFREYERTSSRRTSTVRA